MSFSERWFRFFDQNTPNLILRLVIMLLGIVNVAFGIALSRATDLGVTAISCIPGVLSYLTPITIGVWTFFFNILLVLIQVAILRRDFHPLQFLSIPFILFFSATIDFFVPICALIPMPVYLVRLAFSLLACFFIALGVWLQSKAALVMLPGDGSVITISRVFKKDFGKTKVCFDVTCIVVGAAISLIGMGGFYGVREGSVLAACIVGFIIRFYNKLVPNFERIAPTKGHVTLIPVEKE